MKPTQPQRSLFGEILDWMLAPLLLLWPLSVALTWMVAQQVANKPFDQALGDTALALAQQVIYVDLENGLSATQIKQANVVDALVRGDGIDEISYQVLGLQGEFVSGDHELVRPEDEHAPPGELRFRDETWHNDAVRVAYLWLPPRNKVSGASGAFVQVAETLNKRSRLATDIIKGVILPQFVVLPIAVLLVWLALTRGIAPLQALQKRIRARESHDLSAIEERDVPEEVTPLVRGINELLLRLDQSMQTQKHFLADAAHQLKTPLAGLRTQAELAQREIDDGRQDPSDIKRSLQQIALSSERATRMVNQLLAMARAESKEQSMRREPVDLNALARDVVHDFVPRALEKRIDLGFERSDPTITLMAQPTLLTELIRNLVDNALLYTPREGMVTVRVQRDATTGQALLQVEDSGPGVAPEERERIFQPFYRTLGSNVDGSGLGLAIVREIAQHHDATVTVDSADAEAGGGARFTVRFGAAGPSA